MIDNFAMLPHVLAYKATNPGASTADAMKAIAATLIEIRDYINALPDERLITATQEEIDSANKIAADSYAEAVAADTAAKQAIALQRGAAI